MDDSNRQPSRDYRLDFWRGLAICIVLVDHVEENLGVSVIRPVTPISLRFSDAAEAFVFLSGYVFGLSYKRRLETSGFLACQRDRICNVDMKGAPQ